MGAFIQDGKVVQADDRPPPAPVRRSAFPVGQINPGSAYIGPNGKIVHASREGEVVTFVLGMHGFGDCVHQRAQVRHYMRQGPTYLSTPWPCLYHDLVAEGLHLVKPNSGLYTQGKNEMLEARHYQSMGLPHDVRIRTVRTGYVGGSVIEHGSIVDSMTHDLSTRDFTMPVREEWKAAARVLLAEQGIKGPFAIVRPLTRRAEYPHLLERNPDHKAYLAVCAQVRKAMPLVSVADLSSQTIEGPECEPDADCKLHDGTLPATTLIGLTALAAVAASAPGMMVPLAQAIGTPVIAVFGSYENAQSFAAGYRHTAYLPIEPIEPAKYLGETGTSKQIDLPLQLDRVERFLGMVLGDSPPRRTNEAADPAALNWTGIPDQLRGLFLSELELGALARLLKGRKRVMEIGCQNGRTARVLLNSVEGIEDYIGVDIPHGTVTAHAVQRGEVPTQAGQFALDDPRFKLRLHPRGSLDVEPFSVRWLDAVWIDGDHSRNGVERDTYLALASLRPGGICIWHDDHDQPTVDVSAVLDGYVRTQKWEIRRIEGTWISYMVVP